MGGEIPERTNIHVKSGEYDQPYFSARFQDRDRPALWFYERIIRRWIQPGALLDYGCGTGFLLKRLAKSYNVAGFDISSHAREAAQANVSALPVYVDQADIPDAKFSGIVSLHVLEHIERTMLPDTLACWRRSLKRNGRVLCVIPDANGKGHQLAGEQWIGFGDPSHVTLLGWQEWRQIFLSSGFLVHRIGTDGLWNLPYRAGIGKMRDGLRFSIPTIVQFLFGRLLLPAGAGESAIFLLEKINHSAE